MNPFLDRLVRFGDLSQEEVAAMKSVCEPPTPVAKGAAIVGDGQSPGFSLSLVSGLACRAKDLSDGRRQILSFQVPGDGVDLYGYALKRLDHSVLALTDCQISRMPHAGLDGLISRFPRLTLTLWRETIIDTSILREQLVRIGQRPALERTANLFCEMAHRLESVGLGGPDGYAFPVNQTMLSEALGLSLVHTNRVLRQLREDGALSVNRRGFVVHNRERLGALGRFDPSYLEPTPLVVNARQTAA